MTVLLALPFLLKNEKKEYKRTRNIIVKLKEKYWNLECSSKIIWFLLLLAVLFWVKVELPCFYQILPWLFPQTILFIIVFKIKEYKTGLFYCYVMYECSNSLSPQNLTPTTPSTAPIWKKTVSQLLYITIDLKQHHESSRIIIHGLSTS